MFVTSEEAQANGKSNIVFKQGVTSTDLKNTTSYEGDAISIGLSAGKERKPSMSGLGTGSIEGVLTTGGVAPAAPTIGNLEVKMRDMLIAQGMDADTASNATKGITSLALAGAGVATRAFPKLCVTAYNPLTGE